MQKAGGDTAQEGARLRSGERFGRSSRCSNQCGSLEDHVSCPGELEMVRQALTPDALDLLGTEKAASR